MAANENPNSRTPLNERFKPLCFDSVMEEEATLLALRMIEGLKWHSRLMNRNRIRDSDIITLVGLEFADPDCHFVTTSELRELFADQHRCLERRRLRAPDLLDRNIRKLSKLLNLTAVEGKVLRVAVVTTNSPLFQELLRTVLGNESDLVRAVTSACSAASRWVHRALAEDRPLRRCGFFEHSDWRAFADQNPLALTHVAQKALLANQFDEKHFLRGLIRAAPAATLRLDDFAHINQLGFLRDYLCAVIAERRHGVNVLLYGPPGTGKTQFVRALAPALGADLHEVPNEDGNGEPISGRRRFGAYSICQILLRGRRGQLLLFDEVEDVFGRVVTARNAAYGLLGGNDPDNLRKSWVNETLESNPVPAIWTCNGTETVDPAFLRRFDVIIEFRVPGRAVRRRIVDRYFKENEISKACAERLAAMEHLTPAHVETAARVTRTLRTRDATLRDMQIETVVRDSLRAAGHRRQLAAAPLPSYYAPELLHTDHNLEKLARGLRGRSGARLCLYGPPGTGKTGFVHHLGQVLGRAVLVKRASDLLSRFFGETEIQIGEAFQQASDDEAILLIDEADGFLRDRGGARHPWEVTQVNELLTQMEAFEGIFVASTNFFEALDAAALRRFDFKIRFDYLTRDQRRALLSRIVCAGDAVMDDETAIHRALDGLTRITPGDFSNALRQLRVTGEPATTTRIARLLAQEMAIQPEGRKRRVGFTAP